MIGEKKEVIAHLMSQKGGGESPNNLFALENQKHRNLEKEGGYYVQT